jgi:hypothetical protein
MKDGSLNIYDEYYEPSIDIQIYIGNEEKHKNIFDSAFINIKKFAENNMKTCKVVAKSSDEDYMFSGPGCIEFIFDLNADINDLLHDIRYISNIKDRYSF